MGGAWLGFLTRSSKNSWQPAMSVDTTTSDYWLNWRVLLSALWVLIAVISALFLIIKNDGLRHGRIGKGAGLLYADEVWRPCLREIHPAWLLLFRIFAFLVLLALLVINSLVDGGGIFYFYTQWTFALITVYFGIGSCLSMHGWYQHRGEFGRDEGLDTEQGIRKVPGHGESHGRRPAGFWAYVFQIIFQVNAGAVVLTDCVFWLIIVPFLAVKDYNLNFLIINMHSINAVFLLGDTAMNCLQFPWFRIGYFLLWTAAYVVVQWLVHACVSLWWAYPFLDLSSSWAPLWYLLMGLMHIPCYGIFSLIMRLKHCLLTRWFPQSDSSS